jgi:hypothetical protein
VSGESHESPRDALLDGILRFLAAQDRCAPGAMRVVLERELDRAGSAAILALKEGLASDNGWRYYPHDSLARRIHHVLADQCLSRESAVLGIEHSFRQLTRREMDGRGR